MRLASSRRYPLLPILATICLAGFIGAIAPAVAAPAPPSTTGAAAKDFTGRVVTPDGMPCKNASVTVVIVDFQTPQPLLRTTTDSNGRFTFTGASLAKINHYWNHVMVEAKGWALSWGAIPRFEHTVTVTMKPAAKLSIKCVTLDENPAPGIHIRPYALSNDAGDYFLVPDNAVSTLVHTTGKDGTCVVSDIPAGYRAQFFVEDEQFAQIGYPEASIAPDHPTDNTIHLTPAASISGRVTYGVNGKPAPGVPVMAGPATRDVDPAYAVTGEDGAYVLKRLRAGSYNVMLNPTSEMAQDWTARAALKLDISRGQEREGVDFPLSKGALITGHVTATGTNKPVAQARIGVYGPAHPKDGMGMVDIRSGTDGVYRVRVPAGEQYVFQFLLDSPKGQTLTVADGETATVDFQTTPILPIAGKVLLPDGKPAADADIVALSFAGLAQDGFAGEIIARTDDQGRFTVSTERLRPSISLRARLGTMSTPVTIETEGGDTEMTLRLKENGFGSVAGQVVDSDQKPLAGAKVMMLRKADMSNYIDSTVTDSEGLYSFSGLWPGVAYSIDASATGHGEDTIKYLQLRPGIVTTPSPLVLPIADGAVAGQLIDPQGHPVSGATVLIPPKSVNSDMAMMTTGADGRFHFEHIPRGAVVVNVVGPDQFGHIQTTAGQMDLVINTHPRTPVKNAPRN